jgi:hypothetical protein
VDNLTVYENLNPLSCGTSAQRRQSIVAETLDRFQIVAKKDCIPASYRADGSSWSAWRER